MLKNFLKIISLIFLFIYVAPVYSKKININEFNSKDLSNYFSAIISYDNQKNEQALKFFNLSKPLIESHSPYLKQYIFSLVMEGMVSKAIKELKDNYGNENSWKLLNEDNIVIDSNDSLLNNTLYELSYCLEYSCYKFIINDSYGDGFCCNFGNGYYELYEHTSTTPIAFVQNFSFTDTTYFCLGANSVNEEELLSKAILNCKELDKNINVRSIL